MIKVCDKIWVGGLNDAGLLHSKRHKDWYVLHAAKEPFHRSFVGYNGRGAPKDHPEYLYARRENRMALNMVDGKDPKYIPEVLIKAGVDFISEAVESGNDILIHCNSGISRAPSVALIWMVMHNRLSKDYGEAQREFHRVYPTYNPADGIRKYIIENWENIIA